MSQGMRKIDGREICEVTYVPKKSAKGGELSIPAKPTSFSGRPH